jgi:hypothetical protein
MPLAAAALVFVPATQSVFHGEDFVDLFSIAHDPFLVFTLRPFGGHALVARNIIFYGLFQAFGFWPFPFFASALLTHLVNVALLYALVLELTERRMLACVAALAWGTCPGNDAVIGFYWVYGHLLATTVALAVFLDLARLRRRGDVPSPWRLLLWIAAAAIAATSYGVGLGVAASLPLVAVCLLGGRRLGAARWFAIACMPLVAAAIYRLDHWVFAHWYPTVASPPIALAPMLLALPELIRLLVDLVAFGTGSLLLGFWHRPQSMADPLVFASLAIAGGLLVLAFARARPQERRVLAAAVILVGGVYGVIAAGRGTGMMRALASTPRYHYLGTAAVAVALACAGSCLLRRGPRGSVVTAYVVAVVLGYLRSDFVVDTHADSRAEVSFALTAMQQAAEREPVGGTAYVLNRPLRSVGILLLNETELFPGWAGLFTLVFPDDQAWGRTMRFAVADPAATAPAMPRERIARLLVPLAEARAGGSHVHVPPVWGPPPQP